METGGVGIQFFGLLIGKKRWIVCDDAAVYQADRSLLLAVIQDRRPEKGRRGAGRPSGFPIQEGAALIAGQIKRLSLIAVIGDDQGWNHRFIKRGIAEHLKEEALQRLLIILVDKHLPDAPRLAFRENGGASFKIQLLQGAEIDRRGNRSHIALLGFPAEEPFSLNIFIDRNCVFTVPR